MSSNMQINETEVKDISTLPDYLYHLVPAKFFNEYTDIQGNYDCRNKKEWGRNSPYIHTSPTRKQLKERVADINWIHSPLTEKFLLLEIDSHKIDAKITYSTINGYTYHHIWDALPQGSYITIPIERSKDGTFII
jgi:uncharacterized protein (DUF952 family)